MHSKNLKKNERHLIKKITIQAVEKAGFLSGPNDPDSTIRRCYCILFWQIENRNIKNKIQRI
jgi:hypothetical protein